MLRPLRTPDSHEDLFVARYAQLLAWARQIVGGSREAAEDLVHDAFVSFTVGRPEGIENLDGYLFTTLRNLYLANLRRGRHRETQLPLVEYGSAVEALHAFIPSGAHDELAAICHYACRRRLSSKAGSVLILRFFHGYQPSEIARVIRLASTAVDNLLRISRSEVRVWLQDPQRLRLPRHHDEPFARAIGFGDRSNIARELQAAIFAANRTPCVPEVDLRASYHASAEPLACAALAHLVTCRRCLDVVNEVLGLPRLADRHADDGTEPGRRPPRNPGTGGRAGRVDRTAIDRRVRQVLDGRPTELRIAVNGQVIGGQEVSSARVCLRVLAQTSEQLGFVEVLDQDDERLLLVNTEPPPRGVAEQHGRVALSGGRELSVRVSFAGAWPSIAATYDGAAAEHGPVIEACASDEPRDVRSTWERVRAWWCESLLPSSRLSRPVLVSLGVLLLVLVFVGPSKAWSAVTNVGRTVLEWVGDLIIDRPELDSRARPDASPWVRERDIDLPVILPEPPIRSAPTPRPHGLSEAALLGLEVEVLERLDHVDALYGEGLTLSRPRAGYLRLEGLVARSDRREVLIAALGALARVSQFEIDVRATPPSRVGAAAVSVLRTVEVAQDRTLVSAVLDSVLRSRGIENAAAIQTAMRELAARVLSVSQRALRHTWALTRIARQVPADKLRSMNPDGHRVWRGLLDRHLDGVIRESTDVRTELGAIGLLPPRSEGERDDEPEPSHTAPEMDATHLVRLAEQQDDAMRMLFAAAPVNAESGAAEALGRLATALDQTIAFARRMRVHEP